MPWGCCFKIKEEVYKLVTVELLSRVLNIFSIYERFSISGSKPPSSDFHPWLRQGPRSSGEDPTWTFEPPHFHLIKRWNVLITASGRDHPTDLTWRHSRGNVFAQVLVGIILSHQNVLTVLWCKQQSWAINVVGSSPFPSHTTTYSSFNVLSVTVSQRETCSWCNGITLATLVI